MPEKSGYNKMTSQKWLLAAYKYLSEQDKVFLANMSATELHIIRI